MSASFQQDTKSINPFLFSSASLAAHSFLLSNLNIQATSYATSSTDETGSQNVKTATPPKAYTSNFILRRAFSSLKSPKPQSLSTIYTELERSRRVLSSTGIFKEIKIELEDDDLTEEKRWEDFLKENSADAPESHHREQNEHRDPYGKQVQRLFQGTKQRLDPLYYMNANIYAVEKPSRMTMGMGVSMTMDGDSEVNFSASYRNLLRLADVVSLNVSGTNTTFNEFLQSNSQITWKDTLLSPMLMLGINWKFPFILGEMLTLRARVGGEAIHDTLLNHHVSAIDIHTQWNRNNSFEYSIENRDLLLGGNVSRTLDLIGGGFGSVKSSLKHVYASQYMGRDEANVPVRGISFRMENSIAGLMKIGSAKHVRSQVESTLYFPILKEYIIGSLNAKVGAVAPLDIFQTNSTSQTSNDPIPGDVSQCERELRRIYIGDRVFAHVRGYNHVGKLAYIEQMKNGNVYIDDYQSKGGNIAISGTARAIVPFRSIPFLNSLSLLYLHAFIGFGNAIAYDFKHMPTIQSLVDGTYATYGVGLFLPLGPSARIEFNYNAPLYQHTHDIGSAKNYQKIQLKFFVDF